MLCLGPLSQFSEGTEKCFALVFFSIPPHKCNRMVYALKFVNMFCFLDANANSENTYQFNQDLNLGHRLYYVRSTKM